MQTKVSGGRRTALITGANGGLGFQCAKSILRHGGWNAMIAGRPGEKTDGAVESLRKDANKPSAKWESLASSAYAAYILTFSRNQHK
jgi:NAD(P)-dependent dehydrogenase (short-subunit alcohol dehydrogenase family)